LRRALRTLSKAMVTMMKVLQHAVRIAK